MLQFASCLQRWELPRCSKQQHLLSCVLWFSSGWCSMTWRASPGRILEQYKRIERQWSHLCLPTAVSTFLQNAWVYWDIICSERYRCNVEHVLWIRRMFVVALFPSPHPHCFVLRKRIWLWIPWMWYKSTTTNISHASLLLKVIDARKLFYPPLLLEVVMELRKWLSANSSSHSSSFIGPYCTLSRRAIGPMASMHQSVQQWIVLQPKTSLVAFRTRLVCPMGYTLRLVSVL